MAARRRRTKRGTTPAAAGLVAALALIAAVLVAPARPDAYGFPPQVALPLEALFVLLALSLGRGAAAAPLRLATALVLTLLVALKAGDLWAFATYDRAFDLRADPSRLYRMAAAGGGTLATARIAGAVGGALLAAGLVFRLLDVALRRVAAALDPYARGRPVLASILVLAIAAGVVADSAVAGWRNVRLVADHVGAMSYAPAEVAAARPRATSAPVAKAPDPAAVPARPKPAPASRDDDAAAAVPTDRLFSVLRGKDVAIVYLPNYGRVLLDDPDYATTIGPLLERAGRDVAAAGLTARSAFLEAPSEGDAGWLGRVALTSGRWVPTTGDYDDVVASGRPSLGALFRRAGWRTAALMPAFPAGRGESPWYGHDRVHDAAELGYAPPTGPDAPIPDQFTLAAFQRLERAGAPDRPVMAEIALAGTRSPWPAPPPLASWRSLGDGSGLAAARPAASGDARARYRRAIEGSLTTLVSWLRTYGDGRLVVVLVGEAPPGRALGRATPVVPVHLVARDRRVIDAVASWGWSAGMLPARGAPQWRMSAFRDRFVGAMSAGPAAPRPSTPAPAAPPAPVGRPPNPVP
ncbi:hypothetical protein [Oharaeibacter diazotrophicus]|uniref:Phosphoglycerol transferase MdoB-like AlkP superfamily enzyme n=1 Tax=Oharaeibacter diazotrophicus TaxID=1920512 RepID=A0A4R6RB77_9HYPH|nr:hypothetical protein [Oharaeibacter diazotrophicus]TDP83302.1 hypothetical protein EDD54_3262 [Oharaeibacter diazotrophicus]BBE72136.1 hypothetical protein OHA_1_01723 [Pleomorphomonas sp. SM30]